MRFVSILLNVGTIFCPSLWQPRPKLCLSLSLSLRITRKVSIVAIVIPGRARALLFIAVPRSEVEDGGGMACFYLLLGFLVNKFPQRSTMLLFSFTLTHPGCTITHGRLTLVFQKAPPFLVVMILTYGNPSP